VRCKCYHHCAGHFVHTDELRAWFVRGYILTKKSHIFWPRVWKCVPLSVSYMWVFNNNNNNNNNNTSTNEIKIEDGINQEIKNDTEIRIECQE